MARKLNFTQVCGLAGVGFAVTIVLVNIIVLPGGPPLPGADFSDVSRFLKNSSTLLAVASTTTPLAWVFATLFGAGVVTVLRTSGWSLVGFAGLIAQNVTFGGVVAIRLAFATVPGDAPTLWAVHDALFTINGTFLSLVLVGFSFGGRGAGLIRGWHANLGLASAVLMFVSALLTPVIIDRTGPLGLVALVGWLMWVVWFATYGIVLMRQKRPTPAVREPASAT
jgi:hypothetical protein